MNEERNETNQMWRDIRAEAKLRAAEHQVRDIIQLRLAHDRGEIRLTVFSEYHVRIEGTQPGERTVDYFPTRGTINYNGARSHRHGLRDALAIVHGRLSPTWGSNSGDEKDRDQPPASRFVAGIPIASGDDDRV